MSKKSTKALASAALMSLVLTTALSAGPVKAAQGKVTRTSGTTRYATAAEVAKTNWAQGSKNVVLVSGEGYADAVSASALAKKLDAPILLTASDTLSSDAKSALDTLKPENVYVIGGNASISQNIRDGLKADKYNLTELGGTTRYETNAKVADELVKLGVDPSNVMVVGGEGFSDALSVAPVAAAKGQILLLASNDQSATQPVIDFVKANNSKATVVGTKNVINDTIYDALGAASRVDGGTSRFDTNLKVLDAFKDSLKTDKVYIANASAADPDNLYADALVASAVAGKYSAPLVLVDKDGSEGTTNALAYLKNNTDSSTDVQLIGGTAVVPQSIEDDINALYNPQDQDQATAVDSVESNGLNQIKVTFNGKADSDTAEDLSNYEVDGANLATDKVTYPAGSVKAKLQSDDKTLLITFANKKDQNKSVDVKVKKGVLSEDKSQTVSEFTQNITFEDTTAPTVSSVETRGNKKLVVKFSEPIKVGKNISDIYSKFKVNGNNIASLGLDTDNTEAKDAVKDTSEGNLWTNEIDFYFTTALNTGNNTLKISDGNNDGLIDGAGFPISETTEDFNVDSVSGNPEITSITAEDDGKVYVNFDRPMDKKTATDYANYKINGKELVKSTESQIGNCSDIELKKDDTQVKISGLTGDAKLNKNANTIYIDNNVKDAYGNYVADDTNKSFDLEEDTTKPVVNSVYALNEDTIRVKFSKDVDASYAKNSSNYKLSDNSGNSIDLTNATFSIPGGLSTDTSTDVVDIKLPTKLSDSKYTITIKNIQDLASTPNVMDDYTTTFDGSEDVNAGVKLYKVSDTKVTLVFTKEMDSSTLDDIDNYSYVNAAGDPSKSFPSKTQISVSNDNKSVTIDVGNTSLKVNGASGITDTNTIAKVYATGVKDSSGNLLDVGNNGGEVPSSSTNTSVKAKNNSLRIYYEGKDLKADVNFVNPVDSDTLEENSKADFSIGNNDTTNSINVSPDAVSVNKNGGLTLTFSRDPKDATSLDTNINRVKSLGNRAILKVKDTTKVKDVTGAKLSSTTESGKDITPYFYDAAPKTVVTPSEKASPSNWNFTKTLDSNGDVTGAKVNIQFDTPVANVRPSDFKFNIGGTNIEADDVDVNGSTVTFIFNSNNENISSFKSTGSLVVTPKDTLGNTLKDISTVKDGNGNYAYYVPSSDDLRGITVNITPTQPNP
ncbi:cell wall-binding repeat-containing protein [uncultured Clostridium sp.]|nr:cell wall-binding repeat-containing protein [uncultured Clostridium sp.]